MYSISIINKLLRCCSIVMLTAGAGCIKSSDSAIGSSGSLKFEGGDLRKAIGTVDSFSLFNQALERIGFAEKLSSNNAYTIFAPGNEAMKTVGLDAAGMQVIPIDSLRKIIMYHILPGAIDKRSLEGLPLTRFLQTLRRDTISVPFEGYKIKDSWLSVQNGDKFYLNGFEFNNQQPVTAFNGFIYPTGVFLQGNTIDESRTIWDVVDSDPDLSMFREAVQLLDSLKMSENYYEMEIFGFPLPPPTDIDTWMLRKSNQENNTFINRGIPYILAPVNQAFYDAGFHTIDDLRDFALRYPFDVKAIYNETYTEIEFKYRFSSLDTLLAMNMMWHAGMGDADLRYPSRVLYGDFLNGRLNNGIANRMDRSTIVSAYTVGPVTLQFSQENGIAYVQYAGSRAMILKDADPRQQVNNFNLDNGTLFKVNKLFYPFN
ncbi:MAG TPA: fasciclin domain-containing protein [Pseudobacter sp.]|nr:fasciclin domain-containing protein [Pseudobacter sp.]